MNDAELGRWAEYCSTLLNRPPPPPTPELTAAAAFASHDPRINCAPPMLTEAIPAIGKLKYNKAPGCCNITPRMLKNGSLTLSKPLHSLFVKVWETNMIPCDRRTGVILPLSRARDQSPIAETTGASLCCQSLGKLSRTFSWTASSLSSLRSAALSRAASLLVGRLLIVSWP